MEKKDIKQVRQALKQIVANSNNSDLTNEFKKIKKKLNEKKIEKFINLFVEYTGDQRIDTYEKAIEFVENINKNLEKSLNLLENEEFKNKTKETINEIKSGFNKFTSKNKKKAVQSLDKIRNEYKETLNNCSKIIKTFKSLDENLREVSLQAKNVEYLSNEMEMLSPLYFIDEYDRQNKKETDLNSEFINQREKLNDLSNKAKQSEQFSKILNTHNNIYKLDVLNSDPELYYDLILNKNNKKPPLKPNNQKKNRNL